VLYVIMFLVTCFVLGSSAQSPGAPPDASSGANTEKIYRAGKDGVSSPSCYYMPKPPYTKEAKAAKVEGVVIVEGVITLDGKIEQIRIVKSPGMGLPESVLKTMKKWKCSPAVGPSGKPVPTLVTFEINFRLY
jgi:TonB family protein